MPYSPRTPLLALAALAAAAVPVQAQASAPSPRPAVVETLARDVDEVRTKLVSLARAIPAADWGWRPGEGVRSVEEVLLHVTYDSYYLPTAGGVPAPDGTGITLDYETALAFAERDLSRDEILDVVDASLVHLGDAMTRAGDATLSENVTVFGRDMDRLGLWVLATVHLHDHLGQLIAYARVLDVVPPWSAGG